MADHVCPYGAERLNYFPGYINQIKPCGGNGWLCHRCREDRAAAWADELEAAERGHFEAKEKSDE